MQGIQFALKLRHSTHLRQRAFPLQHYCSYGSKKVDRSLYQIAVAKSQQAVSTGAPICFAIYSCIFAAMEHDTHTPTAFAPSAEGQNIDSSNPGSSTTRAKTGCITCRLRKKRCDEGKPKCAACERLGIECLGYGVKRPKWLRDEHAAKRTKLEIKEKVSQRRKGKQRQSGENVPSVWDTEQGDEATWTSPVRETGGTKALATVHPFSAPLNFITDPDLGDVWRILFGQQQPYVPQPTAGPSTLIPGQNYLHHYLNVVMPLQYRFTGSMSIGDLVAPLAMSRSEVLTSVSSLAALHLSVKRNRTIDPTAFFETLGVDNDALVAVTSHRDAIERLRFISSSDFTAEDIIVSAMFAVSYHTFMGGTSKEWKEVLAISQRCLSAALASSPELTGGKAK